MREMEKKLGLLVWVWFMLCGFCVGRFVAEKNNLKVTSPSSLSGIDERALCLCFGIDFSAFFFFFCSPSLVLMGTAGLWLCSDFYVFYGGCGCMLVVK